ncbi:tudor domain-containing protein 3 [Ochlerotatus camptorhynchus]|uniref:tudor domain-containing protein 3 n=1 Tax=Ochlerotatus camptorhynchus TaxID=644619 RepID=UPI0031DFDF87
MLEQLQEQGWYLLPAGLERLLEGTNGSNIDVKQAIKLALDTDLREIGGGAFGSLSSRGNKADTIEGKIVVQILKIRNISAPKANEESKAAPRLLKLTLTDGQTQYSALEGEHVSSISLDTPPGTKLYLKNGPIKISQGLLILNANCVSVLGGKVPALVEKWQLGRTMAKYAKGGRLQFSASGPPPWIAFGQKIQQNLPHDKNFKSLQTKEKDESKENAEFNALRNDAIAEATKLGTRKTFGGGAKQMVDANVQKIMDKGFTEDQAVHALKLTRNNVHRALSNLQRIEERKQTQNEINTGSFEPPQKPGKRELRGKRESELELTSKPSAKVSLFDYLEDILPESDTSNKKSTSKESTPITGKENRAVTENYSNKQSSYNSYGSIRQTNPASGQQLSSQSNSSSQYNSSNKGYNQRFENNISSSFANRNSSIGSGNRNYNQQPPQQQSYQQNSSASAGYKSHDYNNSRYRGPPNDTNGNHANEAPPRGRQDSKFNQSHSSYNPHSHQTQQPQYRSDNYNNNNLSTGGRGQKYDPNTNSSGKAQSTNANYNYGHSENRVSQGYAGQGDSRKYPNGPSNHYHHQQQQQQSQPQSSYHSGGKQVQGYNVSNSNASIQPISQVSNHYGQPSQHAAGSNSTDNGPNVKPQKGSRYGNKEEPQKFAAPQTNPTPAQGRKQPPKGQQPPGTVAPSTLAAQPPFVSAAKQPSTTPTGNNGKMAQLTEATANLQVSNKPFTTTNPQIMNAPKPHQGSMGSGLTGPTPPPPTTPTTPLVPKNFIQLPNGFNYNPYQIMGFQNKQTNEFALNVLKSQQFDAIQSAHLATQQPGGPPGVAIPPSAAVVPQVLAATPTRSVAVPVHPTMQQTATSGVPNWKVGDRCLSKYWEDGGFYNAEITAISENTFVVCFLEYGNYEEVLKTDCIPLTQATAPSPGHPPLHGPPPPTTMGFHPSATPHMPPPGASMMPHPPPTGAYPGQGMDNQLGQHYTHGYKPQPSQYQHHALSHQQQQRPSKFREQRPMYVPPAQRK